MYGMQNTYDRYKLYNPLTKEEVQKNIIPIERIVNECTGMCYICQRVYFIVPFKDKEQAKQLGMRWDNEKRKWYAPNMNIATCVYEKNIWKLDNEFDIETIQKYIENNAAI